MRGGAGGESEPLVIRQNAIPKELQEYFMSFEHHAGEPEINDGALSDDRIKLWDHPNHGAGSR